MGIFSADSYKKKECSRIYEPLLPFQKPSLAFFRTQSDIFISPETTGIIFPILWKFEKDWGDYRPYKPTFYWNDPLSALRFRHKYSAKFHMSRIDRKWDARSSW